MPHRLRWLRPDLPLYVIQRAIQFKLGFFCAVFLFGCGSEQWKWQEEAKLGNGSSIIVERQVIFGGTRLPWEKDRQQSEYVLIFSSPDNPKIKYEYHSVGGLAPGAIAFANGTTYVLGVTRRGDAIMYYDCPSPPYVVHRFDGGRWKRDELKNFPSDQKKMNIVVALDNLEIAAKSGSSVVAQQIAAWNKDVASKMHDPAWDDIVRPKNDKVELKCNQPEQGIPMDWEKQKQQFRDSMPANTE